MSKLLSLFLILNVSRAFAADPVCVDFESGKIPANYIVKAPKPHSITVQSKIVRSGQFAAKIEVRKGDVFFNDGKPDGYRAELKDPFRAKSSETVWYSISLFIPKYFPIHDNRLVIGQWKGEPDNEEEDKLERSPPLSQRFINGKFKVTLLTEASNQKAVLYESKEFALGAWHDFVYKIKWSPKSDGQVQTWLDGVRIVNYSGPVGFDDKVGPYFKFGLYRDDVPETYIMYFDNYCRSSKPLGGFK